MNVRESMKKNTQMSLIKVHFIITCFIFIQAREITINIKD